MISEFTNIQKTMEINQMLKRQEHFFQSQKTKDYEFRKKALLRLEYAIKKHEKEIEHALYKDLGKSGKRR